MHCQWLKAVVCVAFLCGLRPSAPAQTEALGKLADDFWAWRAKYAPFTADDVNRIERPGGMRDWSRATIDQRRKDLAGFEARWKKLDPAQWPIPKQVDYKLIGSALSRVRWELELNPRWKRDPNFYIDQTLTALAEALIVPAPYDEARSREILTRIENIPSILQQASKNLENPPAPFATAAAQNLDGIRDHLRTMASAIVGSTTLKPEELSAATGRAADALEKFQQQLKDKLPKLPQQTALGRDAYVWLLRNVALMPFTPEELLAMGRQEWNRAVAFEACEKNRNRPRRSGKRTPISFLVRPTGGQGSGRLDTTVKSTGMGNSSPVALHQARLCGESCEKTCQVLASTRLTHTLSLPAAMSLATPYPHTRPSQREMTFGQVFPM